MTRSIDLFLSPEPFAPRLVRMVRPEGMTIAALLADAVNEGKLDLSDVERVRVYVNGEPIPWEATPDYVPLAGQVINIAVEPLGGRTGGKILSTVLTIALVAASFYVGGAAGPLAGVLGGSGAAATSTTAAVSATLGNIAVRAAAAAAIGIGGQMAIGALFSRSAGSPVEEANNRQALTGASNGYRVRGPMPLQLGAQVVAFDLAAAPYTQLEGEDVWLHVIFGLHYGPCTLADLKIGETLLADYPAADIAVEPFLTPGPRAFTLFPGRAVQESLTDELEPSIAEVHTTAENCDRVELDFAWPGGLMYTTEKGKREEEAIHLLIEWRPAGAGGFAPAPLPPVSVEDGPLAPGSFLISAKTRDPLRRTVGWDTGGNGQYDVRVTLIPPRTEPGDAITATYWTAVRTLENKPPILDENLACLALKIRSSDDLNGNLPTVSGLVTPIIPVFNGADWSTEAPSSNAAALARWLLTGPAAAIPLPADQIDASIGDAYDLIEEKEWGGAFRVLEEATQKDVLVRLGKMGRYSTYWNGRKLCFVTDWEKPFPRQIFTARNAQNYRYRRVFPDPIHGVLVEFQTLDETAPVDEVVAYSNGYDETNAELIETLRLGFACDRDRAYREGRVYLAKRAVQTEVHEWTAGIDAVATTYGDRVLVRHWSTLFGQVDATVAFRRFAGALVVGLRLDSEVTFTPGKTYGLDIRRGDQVIRGVQVQNTGGTTRDLLFASPRAVDQSPEKGDLVVFGELDLITEDVELIDVEASAEGTVSFKATRYMAAELEAAETGPIPEWNSGLRPKAGAPTPRIIAVDPSPDGVGVSYDIDPVRGVLVDGFVARWRQTPGPGAASPWLVLPALGASARSFRTPAIVRAAAATDETGDFHPEYAVDVEVRSVIRTGAVSSPARRLGIVVERGVPPVRGLAATGYARTAPDGTSFPIIRVSADPDNGGLASELLVEYRLSAGPGPWLSAGSPLPATRPVGDIVADGGQTYDVRARWHTADNWVGLWSMVEDVAVPAGALVASSVLTIGDKTPQEWLDVLTSVISAGRDATAAIFELSLRAIEERGQLITETFHDGVRVKRILINDEQTWDEGSKSFWERMSLIAILGPDGNSMVVQHDSLMWSPTESYAEHVEAIRTQIGTDLAAATESIHAWVDTESVGVTWIQTLEAAFGGNFTGAVTTLAEVSSEFGASWTVALDVNGKVSGITQLNTGLLSSIVFVADEIGFTDGTGDVFPLAVIDGKVIASNFQVDLVKLGAVAAGNTVRGGTGQNLDSPVTVISIPHTFNGGYPVVNWGVRFSNYPATTNFVHSDVYIDGDRVDELDAFAGGVSPGWMQGFYRGGDGLFGPKTVSIVSYGSVPGMFTGECFLDIAEEKNWPA